MIKTFFSFEVENNSVLQLKEK